MTYEEVHKFGKIKVHLALDTILASTGGAAAILLLKPIYSFIALQS